jgi:hypothetical protein
MAPTRRSIRARAILPAVLLALSPALSGRESVHFFNDDAAPITVSRLNPARQLAPDRKALRSRHPLAGKAAPAPGPLELVGEVVQPGASTVISVPDANLIVAVEVASERDPEKKVTCFLNTYAGQAAVDLVGARKDQAQLSANAGQVHFSWVEAEPSRQPGVQPPVRPDSLSSREKAALLALGGVRKDDQAVVAMGSPAPQTAGGARFRKRAQDPGRWRPGLPSVAESQGSGMLDPAWERARQAQPQAQPRAPRPVAALSGPTGAGHGSLKEMRRGHLEKSRKAVAERKRAARVKAGRERAMDALPKAATAEPAVTGATSEVFAMYGF